MRGTRAKIGKDRARFEIVRVRLSLLQMQQYTSRVRRRRSKILSSQASRAYFVVFVT